MRLNAGISAVFAPSNGLDSDLGWTVTEAWTPAYMGKEKTVTEQAEGFKKVGRADSLVREPNGNPFRLSEEVKSEIQ